MNFSGIVLVSLIAPTKLGRQLVLWSGRIKSILQMASSRKHFQSFVSTTPRLPVLNGTPGEVTMLAKTPRAFTHCIFLSWALKIKSMSSCGIVALLTSGTVALLISGSIQVYEFNSMIEGPSFHRIPLSQKSEATRIYIGPSQLVIFPSCLPADFGALWRLFGQPPNCISLFIDR